MRGALITHVDELGKTPIREWERPLEEKFIALKVITGYKFDNAKWLIQNIFGDLFSASLRREKAGWDSVRGKQLQKMFPDLRRGGIKKVFKIYVWDQTGTRALAECVFMIDSYEDSVPIETVKIIKAKTEAYTKGHIDCSDCGKTVEKSKVSANRFFAGTYCDDCWLGRTGEHEGKGGWQKRESLENYN